MLSAFDGFAHDEQPLRGLKKTARRSRAKRIADVALSIVGLLLLAPAFLLIATALLIVDGRPIIYRHSRIGRHGRAFQCLKFRSMRKDAEARLAELLANDPARREEWQSTRKLMNDPRVHWLGKYLRISSADELPQLLNVLRGDMSLVGPRPVTAAELERYGSQMHCYLEMKPGITGLWQVKRCAETSYEQRVQFDADYYDTCSLRTDATILWQTVGVVLLARNEKERLTK
jgi:exopolysaccharide production protein ExoY